MLDRYTYNLRFIKVLSMFQDTRKFQTVGVLQKKLGVLRSP